MFLQFRLHEGIDRRFRSGPLRRLDVRQGAEAPEFPALLDVDDSAGFGGGCFGARIRGAHPDPGLERLDLRIGEALLGRHLEIPVAVADRLKQAAPLRVARLEGRTGIASLESGFAGVQSKAALCFGRRAVALVAAFDENRADLLFEKF